MNNALIDCKIEERLESMKFISLLTVFSNGKKRKRKIEKMRFYRGITNTGMKLVRKTTRDIIE